MKSASENQKRDDPDQETQPHRDDLRQTRWLKDRVLARCSVGDLAGALIDVNEVLRIDPLDAEAYNHRGNISYGQRDLPSALADLNEALRLRPDFADALLTRAAVRRALGDVTSALADLDRTLRINPEQPSAYFNRGLIRFSQGDLTTAATDFDEVLRVDPRRWQALIFRANIRYHQGEVDQSWEDYRRSHAIDAQGSCQLLARQLATLAKQDGAAVIADCNRHLRDNPNDYLSWSRRGFTLLYLGQFAEAQRDLAERLRLQPAGKEYLEQIASEILRLRKLHFPDADNPCAARL
jgi:tetratricopeptide (TPR) repeat protein